MTSKERLLRAIRHEPVDRVPISTYELAGWNPESWENQAPSWANLMEVIRQETDCVLMMNPEERYAPNPAYEKAEWREGRSLHRKHVWHAAGRDLVIHQREDDGIHTTWTLQHMLESIEDIDVYLSLPWHPPDIVMDGFLHRKMELGEKGIMMVSVPDPICVAADLFEMGTFLTHAITEPDRVSYLLDALHDRQMHVLKLLLKDMPPDVMFRICGPEYATPPYLSPALFPRFVTRYLTDIVREIRQAGAIARIHSHGRIGTVIDQFALTEADAIDPLEPPPDGDMPLAEIKRRYGGQFCLFGNIELKELEMAEPERIEQLVADAMRDAKAGSGFVLMPTASPLHDVLPKRTEENYRKMIECANKYGA